MGNAASGVEGDSTSSYGGFFNGLNGVKGQTSATNGSGVIGQADNGSNAAGVYGTSTNGTGVYGTAPSGYGIYGTVSSASGISILDLPRAITVRVSLVRLFQVRVPPGCGAGAEASASPAMVTLAYMAAVPRGWRVTALEAMVYMAPVTASPA